MALTVTAKEPSSAGNKTIYTANVAFDSSYATGGEAFDVQSLFGIHDLSAVIIEPRDGYMFQYDRTNKKIKAYFPKMYPPVMYSDKLTVSANAVTTTYPAAFIMNVAKPGQNLVMRSTGIAAATLGDNECCLASQMAWGTCTSLNIAATTIITNGTFTGNANNWTVGAAWQYTDNKVEKFQNGTETLTQAAATCQIGASYTLTYTISSWTVGTCTPSMGGVTGTAVGANGTYTETFTATATTALAFTPTNTARFKIDDVTVTCNTVYVSYVTQAWREVWDNLVQDEAVTLATGTGNSLTYTPIAVMYIDQTTATAAALEILDQDDTEASGKVLLTFGASSSQIKAHSAQNTKAVKVTYIKMPSSGFLKDRAAFNQTATKDGPDPYTNAFAYPVLLWSYCGFAPVNGGTTQRLLDYKDTPAAGEARIDWMNPATRGAISTASGAGASHNHTFTGTAQAPALKVEEAVTVTTNVGTLAHVPLYIVAVQATAGSVTGAFSVIPTGETPLTKQVAVNFTTGAMTFLGTDAVTAAKVTYIPKRGSGYLSTVTVDESVTAAAAKANLAARAGLVQYVWDDTDGVIVAFEQPGTAPSATHFCTVDINDATNTSVDSHADDEGNTLKVTYVPYTQIPPGCFIDDADVTLSSEVWNFTGDPGVTGYHNLVVPGFGVNAIGEDGTTARQCAIWEGPTGTAANLVATWNPATNTVLTNNDTAITILSMPWMILDTTQLTPTTPAGSNAAEATHTHTLTEATSKGTIVDVKSNVTLTGAFVWGSVSEIPVSPTPSQVEVENGTDLSAITDVRVFVIGI